MITPQEYLVHHGGRLAVTAGATVLGLAAMSGVGHADSAAPRTGPSPADLTSSLTDTVGGLTGALTGGGGPPAADTEPAPDRKAPPAKPAPDRPKTVKKAAPKRGPEPDGGDRTPRTKAGRDKSEDENDKPGHLRVGLTADLDLNKKTVKGGLAVDAGLRTLLGPAGLRLEADGRLSAEDISIGDPEAGGGVELATHLGDAGLGVATAGDLTVTPAEVSAGGSLDLCTGAGCLDAPTPPSPPGTTPPGQTPPGTTPPGAPSPSPGLPDLPPSSPLLPDLPAPGMGPDTAAAISPAPGDLPITGTASISLAALGLTAVLAGGIAVAVTRRRTPQEV